MPNDNAYARVISTLERAVAAGRPGDRLPSVRELMGELRVGPVTVQRAVAELAARGLLEARPGRGTFIAAPPGPDANGHARAPDTAWQTVALGPSPFAATALEELLRPPAEDAIVLSTGYLPADLQPTTPLANALGRAARRPGAWDRMQVEGLASLRGWFAREIGGGLQSHDVLICSGGQSALSACLRALSPRRGGAICIDSPTYLGTLVAARAAGLDVIPVPTDEHGVRPELLAAALERSGARLHYTQPLFANPTASVLAHERRAQVLDAVRAAGAFLIEDDPVRDFALGPPGERLPEPLLADDPDGHVVHVRSLTKIAAPGLRIAAIAARGPASARLAAARLTEDYFVPGPLQEAAVELLTAPSWPRHVKRVRTALRERRDRLCAEVESQLGLPAPPPPGGMHLWLELPPELDDAELARRSAAAGVVITPGTPWFPAEAPAPHIRLTYAGDTPERLAAGVRRLAELIQAQAR